MFQGFLVLLGWEAACDAVIHCCMQFLPPYPFSSRPFTGVGTAYIKWRGGRGLRYFFFPPKGGTSLSKEKKACCTRLAGSDISQRRFACCHSQSKMPPLPRSQSATLLFCVPEMYPSGDPGMVGLARRLPGLLEGHLLIPEGWR
uniref:Secreted protein n=1 Tax=Saimiri boliviensis boliviensis TaxID=39432 RepID=A0A2K6S6M8_SAIBB